MEILMKEKTEKFDIQLEDWSKDYSCFNYGSTIGLYQPAKEDVGYCIKRNKITRFDFNFKNNEEALKAYNDLLLGNKKPIDFIDNLHDPRYKIAL